MSASLVGSEMCIRDRLWASRGPGRCPRSTGSSTGSGAGSCTGSGTGTVSYTHLTLPTICSV
eukprot:10006893-Alexandrium_andersonii.AAC.1